MDTAERPCEGLGRSQPWERHRKRPALLTPWSQTPSLLNGEKFLWCKPHSLCHLVMAASSTDAPRLPNMSSSDTAGPPWCLSALVSPFAPRGPPHSSGINRNNPFQKCFSWPQTGCGWLLSTVSLAAPVCSLSGALHIYLLVRVSARSYKLCESQSHACWLVVILQGFSLAPDS